MLDFQPKKRPRNWLARKEQSRLLLLVLLLVGVGLAFDVARDPGRWTWVTRLAEPPAPPEDIDLDNRLRPEDVDRDLRAGLVALDVEPGAGATPAAASGERFPGLQVEYLRGIRDRTVLNRAAESDAFFHLLGLLHRNDQETLERASGGRVTFLQLFGQPEVYRAEVVTVAGEIRRAVRERIPQNYVGLDGDYYQFWLKPDRSSKPIIVYSLSAPEGFPVELEMREKCEVTGFFYKLSAYPAAKDIRVAPVLLAKTIRWKEVRVTHPFEKAAPAAVEAAPAEKAEPIASAREYMAKFWEMEDEDWSRFADGKPIDVAAAKRGDEGGTLLRLIGNLPRLPSVKIEAWRQKELDRAPLAAKPAENRGKIYAISGHAQTSRKISVPADMRELFEFDSVYRTEIQPTSGAAPLVVYSSDIPKDWLARLGGEELDEPVRADGIFVKAGGADPARPGASPLVFAASRLAWYPDTLLGQLGMDVALFDELTHNAELSGGEAAAQFNLLAAVGRADRDELETLARDRQFEHQRQAEEEFRKKNDAEFDYRFPEEPSNAFILNDIRGKPAEMAGRLVTLRGTALRAIRIELKREDAARYGFDHFYQVDASVGLEPPITIVPAAKAAADGQEAKERTIDHMTVTFCLRRLPEQFPVGDSINEPIRVPGFFFKVWTANSVASLNRDLRARDFYPMVIGPSLIWFETKPANNWFTSWIIGGTIGLVVLSGVGAWVVRRGQKGSEEMIRRQRTTTEGSLNDLGIDAPGKPDFAFLNSDTAEPPPDPSGESPPPGESPA